MLCRQVIQPVSGCVFCGNSFPPILLGVTNIESCGFGEISYFYFMADVHNTETRSYNMSRIKGKNTKPELLVRKFLFANGFRYRLNVKELPGKPDLVLPKYKTVIFINGCFWHGHKGCRYFVLPKTRTEWWLQKIKGTMFRDKEAEIKLNVLGWRVITIWECELTKSSIEDTLASLVKAIKIIH